MPSSLSISSGNNEGAIKDSPWARAQPGYKGKTASGFAIFDDDRSGVEAQHRLLQGPRYAGLPITTIIAGDGSGKRGGYAPIGPENSQESVNNYIHYVAQRTGLDPRKPVPQDKVPIVASAMREFETGQTQGVKKREETFAEGISAGLGDPNQGRYTVGPPTAGEKANIEEGGNFGIAGPDSVDQAKAGGLAGEAVDSSEGVASFLKGIVEPIRANSQAIVAETNAVSATKHRLADDVEARGTQLLAAMAPLQERRLAIAQRMTELDAMSPFERKLKAAFNADYDYNVLRGRMARADEQIGILENQYKEVNAVKTGIVAAMIDADAADVDVLQAKSNSLLSEAQLLGQVSGAIRTAADMQLYPLQLQVSQQKLQAEGKARLLGTMTTEAITDLYIRARDSETGTVTVDGAEISVGELQGAARESQQADMSFRNMQNALQANDLQTADAEETRMIDHLSPEKLDEVLKNGGVMDGKQLSLSKLTSALERANAIRTASIQGVVQATTVGQAGTDIKGFAQQLRSVGGRAQEMFGQTPKELSTFGAQVQSEMQKFQAGLKDAEARGVRDQYIAAYMPQIQAMQTAFDQKITEVAKNWGGGNAGLTAVADSYLHGNPISGDVALKGLISIAKSGMPAGAKLEGPAAAALKAASAVVQDWESPAAVGPGDLSSMLSPTKKTEADLIRRVRSAVQTVYADNITNELFAKLPQIAQTVRNEQSPGKVHPFARVTQQEFDVAVRHGDNEGYAVVGQELDLNPVQTARMFREGPDGATWKQVMAAKGLQPGQFADYQQVLQSTQMAAMLQALDAGSAARDGFSPAQAFVDFMQTKEVSNKVDQIVQSYGNSGFGAYVVSSSAGGGYRDGWAAYAQSLATVHQQLHAKELKQAIDKQRGLFKDPSKRMGAVLGAAGLSKQESATLTKAVQEVAHVSQSPIPLDALAAENLPLARLYSEGGFDKLTYVVQNHKFEDPQVERIRQKAAKSWSDMDAVISLIEETQR